MTVQTTNISVEYQTDGASVEFGFDFTCYQTSWIVCVIDGAPSTIGFAVTLFADQESSAGGYVTFETPPPDASKLFIVRAVDLTQLTDYAPYTRFPAQAHEEALDKLTMIDQQIQAEVDAIKGIVHQSSDTDALEIDPQTLTGDTMDFNLKTNVALGLAKLDADGLIPNSILPPIDGMGDFRSDGTVAMSGNLNMGDNSLVNLSQGVFGAGSVSPLALSFAVDPNAGIYGNGVGRIVMTADGSNVASAPQVTLSNSLNRAAFIAGGSSLNVSGNSNSVTWAFSGTTTYEGTVTSHDFKNIDLVNVKDLRVGGSLYVAQQIFGTDQFSLLSIISENPNNIPEAGGVQLGGFDVAGNFISLVYGSPDSGVRMGYNSQEAARTRPQIEGGLQAFNLFTGAGYERVLTESDSTLSARVTTLDSATGSLVLDDTANGLTIVVTGSTAFNITISDQASVGFNCTVINHTNLNIGNNSSGNTFLRNPPNGLGDIPPNGTVKWLVYQQDTTTYWQQSGDTVA